MHLSLSSFCYLCAEAHNAASLTNVASERGKQENLEALLKLYIMPILLLPKDDKMCVCDTCKAVLLDWESFISRCKKAQQKIKEALLFKSSQNELPNTSKRPVDAASDTTASVASSPRKKRSSNYCIARWCNIGNYQGVSLFRLPKERDRALAWLTAADRSDLKCMPTLNSYYLCANHFVPNMFTNNARNQLIRKATPSVFTKSPYANKVALKAATSQVLPTQFQGVQLKSILPKLNSSNNLSPLKFTKVVLNSAPSTVPLNNVTFHPPTQLSKDEKLSADGQILNPSIKVISSNFTSTSTAHENALHVVNSVHSICTPQNSIFPSSLSDNSGCSIDSASAVVSEEENGTLLYCFVKSTPTPITEAVSEPVPMKASLLSIDNSKQEPLVNSSETKLKPLTVIVNEQKHFLEEIESCFTPDPFHSNTLLSVEEPNISQELKKSSSLFNKQSFQCASSDMLNIQSQASHQNDSYQSSVGSQDLLLPHFSEKVMKSSPSLTEPSYPPGSVVPVNVADVIHSVSGDSNPVLNHNNGLNSPHISLFDLPSDDIQGTDNASFINNIENLDELMDLDKYFEGR